MGLEGMRQYTNGYCGCYGDCCKEGRIVRFTENVRYKRQRIPLKLQANVLSTSLEVRYDIVDTIT